MNVFFGPKTYGARALVAATSALIFSPAFAQSEAGVSIDPNVVNLFIESRTQKPAAQATAEERNGVMNELRDIYLVTNQDAVAELAESPSTKAQLELQRRAILFNAFALDFLAKNPATDQEVFDFYQEQVALNPPEEFKARHILVESQAQAIGLIEQLDGGADFATLAKEHSTGPSGPGGGDLGWFEGRSMVAEFSTAVTELENGGLHKIAGTDTVRLARDSA